MITDAHFKARFRSRTSEEGGLASPLYTGYFPLFDFDGEHEDGGEITIIGAEMAMPGDEFMGEVEFLEIEERHIEAIYPGADFTVREKGKIVATGLVTEIYFEKSV
ncbi:MAG: hypothetical protein AB8F95_08325 [Bacteroidia bacterium]